MQKSYKFTKRRNFVISQFSTLLISSVAVHAPVYQIDISDIEIIPPLEDDTLDVIEKYNELHAEGTRSYTPSSKAVPYSSDSSDVSNLDILEQQLFRNVEGKHVIR